MKKTLLLLATTLLLNGCGDYYINVDKEAIKLEADHLLDGQNLHNTNE